jgi:hypothetical protein
VAKYKGEQDNKSNKDKLGNAFKALLVNIDKEDLKHLYTYFTLIKNFLIILSIIKLALTIIAFLNTLIKDLSFLSLLH